MKAQVSAINKEKALEKVPSLNIVYIKRCTLLSRLENSRYLFTAAEVGRPGCVRWLGRYCYSGYWASTLLSPHPRHVTKVRHRQGGKYAAATRHQAAATAALTAEIYRQL